MTDTITMVVESPEKSDKNNDNDKESRNSSKGHKTSSLEETDFNWPYAISIDLRKSPKPKVAFLSGEERQYYPENPGHTRMGVEFAMNTAAGDVPNPNYYPPILGVHKPISLLGFGIGGLLAARFPKDVKSTIPDSGMYQKIIDRRVGGVAHPYDAKDPVLRRQCRIAFGSGNKVSRFGIERMDQPPGPGSYDVIHARTCKNIKKTDSFGSKSYLIPSVLTICMVDGGERCCECGQVQLADYYRSKTKLKHPEKKRPAILAMCRSCYCKASNGHFQYWNHGHQGGSVPGSPFYSLVKARHCNYIHDHQKLSQFMHKTTTHLVKRLTMKEVILKKHYNDCCPPEYTFGKSK